MGAGGFKVDGFLGSGTQVSGLGLLVRSRRVTLARCGVYKQFPHRFYVALQRSFHFSLDMMVVLSLRRAFVVRRVTLTGANAW